VQRALRRAELGLRGGLARALGDGGIGGLAGHSTHSRACRVVSRCAKRANRTIPHTEVHADTSPTRQLPDNIGCRLGGPFPSQNNMRLIARFVFLVVAVFGVSLAFAWAWDQSDKPQDTTAHASN
jgi:hypothetical protein